MMKRAADVVAYCVDNPRKARTIEDPEQWPGLNLCFGLNDGDELTFEHFDNDAWVAAGRPEDLTLFFVPVTLTLSPLPASEGRDARLCGPALRAMRWARDRRGRRRVGRADSSSERAQQPFHLVERPAELPREVSAQANVVVSPARQGDGICAPVSEIAKLHAARARQGAGLAQHPARLAAVDGTSRTPDVPSAPGQLSEGCNQRSARADEALEPKPRLLESNSFDP